jgi:hypothetical protein
MNRSDPSPRRRPSASLVIALVALFIALGSGAYAASKIGTKQLKNKAVTTKKLDNKAVSGKKLASKAVSAKKLDGKAVKTNKLAPGAVTGSKIDEASTPFGRVVHTAMGDTEQALGAGVTIYPLTSDTYTQKADQVNEFLGAVDVRFEAGCTQPRGAVAYVVIDPMDLNAPQAYEIALYGALTDEGTGAVTRRNRLGPYPTGTSPLFQPGSDKSRHLYLGITHNCTGGAGVTATGAEIDVVGTTAG